MSTYRPARIEVDPRYRGLYFDEQFERPPLTPMGRAVLIVGWAALVIIGWTIVAVLAAGAWLLYQGAEHLFRGGGGW